MGQIFVVILGEFVPMRAIAMAIERLANYFSDDVTERKEQY